jgi:hypothetical protein
VKKNGELALAEVPLCELSKTVTRTLSWNGEGGMTIDAISR